MIWLEIKILEKVQKEKDAWKGRKKKTLYDSDNWVVVSKKCSKSPNVLWKGKLSALNSE